MGGPQGRGAGAVSDGTYYPGILGDLVRRNHLVAAERLARAWGGTKRSIPCAAEGTVLAELIGLEAARVVVEVAGNRSIDIPLIHRYHKSAILLTYANTRTRETAQALGCTERHVRKVRQAVRPDPDQGTLF